MLETVPSDRRQLQSHQLDLFEIIAQPPVPPPRARTEVETLPTEPKPISTPGAGEDRHLTALARTLTVELGMHRLAKAVNVVWNPRLRTTAGRAYRHDSTIELNPGLVQIAVSEIDRTLRHELAHLVAYARAGRRRIDAHGPEWRQACIDLEIPSEARCHDLPFKGTRQRRKWSYQCPSCAVAFERVRRVKWAAACHPCCRKFNGGAYDNRFRLVESQIKR